MTLSQGPTSFDAIVIGTGFGGAATACRLAQAEMSILVLERGGRYQATDYPELPSAETGIRDIERWSWHQGGGLWDVRDLGPLLSAQAAGYGGGSLIYSNVHLRPPRAAFDDWPPDLARDALAEHYDLAAWMLEAAPIDAAEGPLADLAKTREFDAAASRLGRDRATFHPPLAISYAVHDNAFGHRMAACDGCGRCWVGCPRSAKNTLDHNYLAVLESFASAQIAIRCEARAIHALDGGYAVEYRDHLAGTVDVAHAPLVIVAAGVLGTIELLARSRAAAKLGPWKGLPNVSARLGDGYHSNGDGISFAFDTANRQSAMVGPTITSCSVQERPHFAMIQDGGGPPELAELLGGLFNAPYLLGRNRYAAAGPSRAPGTGLGASAAEARPPPSRLELTTVRLLREVIPVQLYEAGTRLVEDAVTASRPEFERLVDGIIGRLIHQGIASLSGERIRPGSRLHSGISKWLWQVFARAFGDREDLIDFAQRMVAERLGLDELGAATEFALSRLLHGRVPDTHRVAVLLTMGRTSKGGRLDYDPISRRLIGQLDLKEEQVILQEGELLARDFAGAFGAELRTNPMVAALRKPITVHSQGGCAMAESAEGGVTSLEGEVHGHPGLFVADASLFPGSVGVNPSATVLAVAERNVLALVRRLKGNTAWPEGDDSLGARQFAEQRRRAGPWVAEARRSHSFEPPEPATTSIRSRPVGIAFRERLWGFHGATERAPEGREAFYALEAAGAPARRWEVDLEVTIENLEVFLADPRHQAAVRGQVRIEPGGGAPTQVLEMRGHLHAFVAAEHAVRPPADERVLAYVLSARDEEGREHRLSAFKEVSRGLSRFTWRALSVALATWRRDEEVLAAGVLRLQLERFAREQLPETTVTGTDDPARIAWALVAFGRFFGESVLESGSRQP